jgi:hypothetical protein
MGRRGIQTPAMEVRDKGDALAAEVASDKGDALAQKTTEDQQEEVQWVRNNIDNIIAAAYNDGYGFVYTPSLRDTRDQKLFETDWMVTRHRDQQEASFQTTLSYAQYVTLLNYRQALRDITNTYTNLDDVVWPLLDI